MEIDLDRSRCEANAVCVGLAPEVFDLNDEEELVITPGEIPAELVERVSSALAACPKNALFIAH
ncbi:MAG TPA: ferredoxin [Amycolatopsis sp.]|nr:ferredoxin [Amycolatopsis sp.]